MIKKYNELTIIALLFLIVALSIIFSSCVRIFDYEINFDVDGTIYSTISSNRDEAIKIPDDPTKDGYIFTGWYWEDGREFTVNSLMDTPISSNITVYAK